MKRLFIAICVLGILFIQPTRALEFHFNYASFFIPEEGTYTELYFRINGQSLNYIANDDELYGSAVELRYHIVQGDSSFHEDRYMLKSPLLGIETDIDFDLIDLKRIPLPPGIYRINIIVTDLSDTTNSMSVNKEIQVRHEVNKIFLSDIELIDTYVSSTSPGIFTKNQYDITPYVLNYYPSSRQKMIFYAEVYNSEAVFKNDIYLIDYSIHYSGGGKVVGNLRKFMKMTPKGVNVVFAEIGLQDLPSGNYDLVVEVRDKQNILITQQQSFFFRMNESAVISEASLEAINIASTFVDSFDKDKIIYYLKSVIPIASRREETYIDNLLRKGDAILMKQFYLNFWQKRDPADSYLAFYMYQLEVNKVNEAFSTSIYYGFETDRGDIYLKYKPPNEIVREYNETDALPYEIWHYYDFNDQRNVKFVFYNPDLVTNDFILIHSNARGENHDPRWKAKIYKQNSFGPDYEDLDDLRNRASDYFDE